MHGFQLIGKIARTNFGEALITAHWKNRAHQFRSRADSSSLEKSRAPISFTRWFRDSSPCGNLLLRGLQYCLLSNKGQSQSYFSFVYQKQDNTGLRQIRCDWSPPVRDGAKAWLLHVYSMSSVSPNKPARCCERGFDPRSVFCTCAGRGIFTVTLKMFQTFKPIGLWAVCVGRPTAGRVQLAALSSFFRHHQLLFSNPSVRAKFCQ